MVWSNTDFTRKIKTVKDSMRNNEFYNDKILTRIVNRTGASGLYNRNMVISHTDTEVKGVVVYRADVMNYDNDITVINGDAQFTCAIADKDTILDADELWLDYTTTGSSIISGTMYKVKSSRNCLFGVDHIFELAKAGDQSV
ncbi:MAG: hypothetical protein PHN69_04135 [Candidatus Pacebacteria bacterium]|nr:hypothetical protein [Candidatus Paceibacterota bacterium]